MEKIKIFVSYSHEDEEWVSSTIPGTYKLIPWLERQLKSTAEIWTDHSLKELPGERYNQLITEKILDADIALLLISQDFVSSEYIMGTELPLIKHQYDDEKIKIIPLLITNVSTEGKEKISWIFDLQTYPNDTKPLIFFIKDAAEWSNVKVEILNGINNKITSVKIQKKSLGFALDSGIKTSVNSNQFSRSKKKRIVLGVSVLVILLFSIFIWARVSIKKIDNEVAIDNFNIGNTFKNNEKYNEAITYYNRAISLKPDFAEAYHILGFCYHKKSINDTAIIFYQKAISFKPDFADAYNDLGISYERLGDDDNAIAAYRKAISIKPDFAMAYNNLGNAYYGAKKYKMQIECYKKAAQLGDKGCQQWLKSHNETW
jgi:tetratricopeptide (TPR) repeat protein